MTKKTTVSATLANAFPHPEEQNYLKIKTDTWKSSWNHERPEEYKLNVGCNQQLIALSVSRPSCSGSWMVLVGKYFKPLSRDGTKLYLTCLFLQWGDLKDRWGKWKFGALEMAWDLYFLLQLLGCVCCCTWINWATTENSLRFSPLLMEKEFHPKPPWGSVQTLLWSHMSERKLFLYFTLSSWKLRKMLTNQT